MNKKFIVASFLIATLSSNMTSATDDTADQDTGKKERPKLTLLKQTENSLSFKVEADSASGFIAVQYKHVGRTATFYVTPTREVGNISPHSFAKGVDLMTEEVAKHAKVIGLTMFAYRFAWPDGVEDVYKQYSSLPNTATPQSALDFSRKFDDLTVEEREDYMSHIPGL